MPEHLITACGPHVGNNHPLSIAAQIVMYLEYHLDRGSRTELLVFTRTDFLTEILQSCLDLDPAVEPDRQASPVPRINWGRNPRIRAEERLVLVRSCIRAYFAALAHTERLSGLEPLTEVEQNVRKASKIKGVFDVSSGCVVGLTGPTG